MENIKISSKFDSTFEFDVMASGIEPKKGEVLFRVETSPNIRHEVKCEHLKGDTWSVTVPKDFVENGSYNFSLCVIFEDFFFEPVKGKLTVVSEKTVTISGKKVEVEEKPKEEAKKEEPKEKPTPKPKRESKTKSGSIREKLDKFSKPPVIETQPAVSVKKESSEETIDRILESMKHTDIEDVVDVETGEVTEITEDNDPNLKVKQILASLKKPELQEIIDAKVKEKEEQLHEDVVKPTPDANEKVKMIIRESRLDTVQPTPEPIETKPEPTETMGFFESIEEMKKINETRRTNRKVKDVIRQTTKKK